MTETSDSMKPTNRKQPQKSKPEVEAWQKIADALHDLDPSARARIIRSVTAFYEMDSEPSSQGFNTTSLQSTAFSSNQPGNSYSASDDRAISPKEFLNEKQPTTDIDRVACLAYYLANYRNTPQFKTVDISKLNTEAAQIKFSNAASSVDNASKQGFLVPASKGHKQLSAAGERYVAELPDRSLARSVMSKFRKKKVARKPVVTKSKADAQ